MLFVVLAFEQRADSASREKNGFVTATKSGTTNKFFVAATKTFAEQPNVLLIERNILL